MTIGFAKSGTARLVLASAASLLVALTVGCGDNAATGTVKGKVMLGDEPFGEGSLILVSPVSGKGTSVDLQADGSFTIEKPLPVDEYTVYVAPKSDEDAMAEAMKQGKPPELTMSKDIPEKYLNEVTSDLRIKVEEGENDVTVTMESD